MEGVSFPREATDVRGWSLEPITTLVGGRYDGAIQAARIRLSYVSPESPQPPTLLLRSQLYCCFLEHGNQM